ncbi:hypothetical protein GGR55DRAFT_104906 [Xylaria sp. FL0064]|nr:hypothetical protein GGR55DRAFT_104906 [Xylaria sp. FL0064]
MEGHTVPKAPGADLKISHPHPDALYGYRGSDLFSREFLPLVFMGRDPYANRQNMLYPFLVIEFRGVEGSMWEATNQCLGDTACCVNMIQRLNEWLKAYKDDDSETEAIENAVFSFTINDSCARLYISWKDDNGDYLMQLIDAFAIQNPRSYLELRSYVNKILDWRRTSRLDKIRRSLKSLAEAYTKAASAKSRQPPSDNEGSESGRPSKKQVLSPDYSRD